MGGAGLRRMTNSLRFLSPLKLQQSSSAGDSFRRRVWRDGRHMIVYEGLRMHKIHESADSRAGLVAARLVYLVFVSLLICSRSALGQPSNYCRQGEQLFKDQNYRAAQVALWQCLASGAITQDQTVHLTWTYRDLKNYDEGLSQVSDLLTKRSDDENLLYVGAFLHFRRNELEQSVELLNRAYKLKPDDWRLHQLYALNFVEVGWALAAEKEFNRAIKLRPDEPELYYQMARYYYTMNEFDKAVSASEKALGLAPEYASVYDNLGLTYAGQGDSARA
jgi:tetratricopeptide (TPR) repeat protein